MFSPSLYIHIPFCLSKCDYCDFFSIPCGNCDSGYVPDNYITALINELHYYRDVYQVDSFRTLYIGGGTPSLLRSDQLKRILQVVASFSSVAPEETTVEMNPETVSEDLLGIFAEYGSGIRRLSLGIQSLNDSALTYVHRHCTAEKARKALDLVKKTWRGELNLDIIAGLCAQNPVEYMSSLKEILSYESEHISLYTLTLEEGTPLYKNLRCGAAWDGDEADDEWLEGRAELLLHGYNQYEVSNFAKKGHESRHNLRYWKQDDYIGIGSGATGTIYSFEENKKGFRWTDCTDVASYISFWDSFCDKSLPFPREEESLSLETEEEEFLMMGLRSTFGISAAEYKKRFSPVKPWQGDLEARLGVRTGAWKRFSELEGISGGCMIKRCENDYIYSLEGNSLMFLNTFLKYLT